MSGEGDAEEAVLGVGAPGTAPLPWTSPVRRISTCWISPLQHFVRGVLETPVRVCRVAFERTDCRGALPLGTAELIFYWFSVIEQVLDAGLLWYSLLVLEK